MKLQTSALSLLLCLGISTAAVTVTGCAGSKYSRSTGQYIDDKTLTMRVHDALEDNPNYKYDDVNVNVFRGTVQLSGFVNNQNEKNKASKIAKKIQGVNTVVNNITVKGQ